MKRTTSKLFLFTALLSAVAFAGKHAPLPPALLEAKTVYIQNDSGMANLSDRCFDELTKWGRFKVVSSPKDADIIFLLSAHTTTTGYSGSTTPDYNGGSTTNLSENRVGHTGIFVIQKSTNEVLWSDTKTWGGLYTGFRSATKSIVKELRKRIEEQEAESKAASK